MAIFDTTVIEPKGATIDWAPNIKAKKSPSEPMKRICRKNNNDGIIE